MPYMDDFSGKTHAHFTPKTMLLAEKCMKNEGTIRARRRKYLNISDI